MALPTKLPQTFRTVKLLDAGVGEGVPSQCAFVGEHLSAVVTHEGLHQLLLSDVHGHLRPALHARHPSPALFTVPQFVPCVDED